MLTGTLKHFSKWLLIGLFIAGLVFAYTFLRANPDPDFWFVPSLPVPSYAENIVHSYNSLSDSPLGGYRIITFQTDQPAEKIQQFYRIELSKRGWYLLCSPTLLEQPGCPLGLSPNAELADAYERNDDPSRVRATNFSIFKPGDQGASSDKRLVEVIEYRYPISSP
jgi:hypothetical protein